VLLRRLAEDRLRMEIVRVMASLAAVMAFPVAAAALFFLDAMTQERGDWNPAPDEAVIVPLIWLGAVLLPVCAWRLLSASPEPRISSGPAPEIAET
jgi:hypothetical protein